ncbi:hypothetical protein [Glycomyces sp. NRRL B-16210]|nr:hypothetical protein [Glycomyces sp. NRRL B-16210]
MPGAPHKLTVHSAPVLNPIAPKRRADSIALRIGPMGLLALVPAFSVVGL